MKTIFFSFIILILLAIINTQNSEFPEDFEKRALFYQELINTELKNPNLVIGIDQNGPFVASRGEFSAKSYILSVPQSLMISSCDFYPLKDLLVQGIHILVKKDKLFNISEVEIYSLVLHLLYLKKGNKSLPKEIYKNSIHSKSRFFKYESSELIKKYLSNFPKVLPRSAYFYDENELQLARNLKMDLTSYDKTIKMFNHLRRYVERFSEDQKTLALSFLSDKKSFLYYTGFVVNSENRLPLDNFVNLLSYGERKYAKEYNEEINKKTGINHLCAFVAPIFDLIRHYLPQTKSKNDKIQTFFGFDNDNYKTGLIFGYYKKITENEVLQITKLEYSSSEKLLIEIGYLQENKQNFFMVQHKIKKNELDEEKVQKCMEYGCSGLDLVKFYENSDTSIIYDFNLFGSFLNSELLTFFKFQYSNENQLRNENFISKLASNALTYYSNEMKAISFYFKKVYDESVKLSYIKVLQDLQYALLKLKLKNHSLQNMFLMLYTVVLRLRLIKNQLELSLDYAQKLLKIEFNNIKNKYLN